MTPELKPVIQQVLEEPTLRPDGTVRVMVRTVYKVGPHGPFTVLLDRADFSAARVQQEIAKIVKELQMLA